MSGVSRYNEVRKQMEVLEMFRHKAEKRIVELGFGLPNMRCLRSEIS